MGYSQYNEEEFLKFYFKDRKGLVVEIGAADGINNSNSRMLIENGWRSLLIEPNTNNYNKLVELYKGNNNVIVENIGCSNITEEKIFYIDHNDEYQQLSTFSKEQVVKCKNMYSCEFEEKKVEVIKTSELFSKYNISKIDFLSIDTESYDENVFSGIDFNIVDIEIICVEDNIINLDGYELIFQNIGNKFYKRK